MTGPLDGRTGDRRAWDSFDAIVVGARCAGAPLATWLARAGWRVALVDAAGFPSDTVSTHVVFPDGLALLDDLGALARLRERHRLTPVEYSWRVLGHEVAGGFTPVCGHDRALAIRRVTLDAALVETAEAAGATVITGVRVTDVAGRGTPEDPVRGVRLASGRMLHARWVIGADGRLSTVARRLGVEDVDERRGEIAMLLGYWRGLPPSGWCRLDMRASDALMTTPCEDGIHLISVAGDRTLTRGGRAELEERYHRMVRSFPSALNPRLLDHAELIGGVVAAPETMMRGFFRRAAGPGWALVGDAGHFKHPSTAQGIGDALAQARYVATDLTQGGDLAGYAEWRERRSVEAYEFSYRAARFPGPEMEPSYAGLAADPVASRLFLDTFARQARLSDVFTPERTRRWNLAAAYEDGLRRVLAPLESADPAELDALLGLAVPACPGWGVTDLLAHLAGAAADALKGGYFAEALEAWASPEIAAARDAWTAGHVVSGRDRDSNRVLADLRRLGTVYVEALRRGAVPAGDAEDWLLSAPTGDLSVHLGDLHEAWGTGVDPAARITRTGFTLYRAWLDSRLAARGLPPLRLSDGSRSWVLGGTEPTAAVTAPAYTLFRAISGRLPLAQVRALDWSGDPEPVLEVLSPYPWPEAPRGNSQGNSCPPGQPESAPTGR